MSTESDETAVSQWTALVDAVLSEPLYWFPVKHHSPVAAYYLRRAIRARRRPKVILLEGPAQASALIPHLLDERTQPPVALYSSFRNDNNVLGLAGIASPAPDLPACFARQRAAFFHRLRFKDKRSRLTPVSSTAASLPQTVLKTVAMSIRSHLMSGFNYPVYKCATETVKNGWS